MNLSSILKPSSNGKHYVAKENPDPVVGTIYSTTDYGKFKFTLCNRRINEPNLRAIIRSMQKMFLISVVIVNERFEVIDGQHRVVSAKKLGLPVYYTICPGYGMDETRHLNKAMRKWAGEDHIHSWANSGKQAYVELIEFRKQFPDLTLSTAKALLTGVKRGTSFYRDESGANISAQDIENGEMRIRNVTHAYITARRIMDFKDHFKNFSDRTFVNALLSIMSKRSYNHKRMMHKLGLPKSPPLEKCGNDMQYRILLQEIFNTREPEKSKVYDFVNKSK